MLRIASKRVFGVRAAFQVNATPSRSFFFKKQEGILTDVEQQAGRRKEEADAEAEGIELFNSSAIIPDASAGTKENPILVPSAEGVRPVGYEDPNSHQIVWFNLKAGPLHYVPRIGLYFKLKEIAH